MGYLGVSMEKWIVNTKGEPGKYYYEIAVVKENNNHGIASYGWGGIDKHIISASYRRKSNCLSGFLWDELLKVAEKYAIYLNTGNVHMGIQVNSLDQLCEMALEKKSIVVPGTVFGRRHQPAAFILNLQGRIIAKLIKQGMYEYIPKRKRGQG
jgi:hypothetical protein